MERIASIELAFKNEQTERDFYLREESRSNNKMAKEVFAQLAQEEEEHMSRVGALHQKLVKDGSWPKDVPLKVAGSNVKDVIDHLIDNEGSHEGHDENDLEALKIAIHFEAKAVELYKRIAGECESTTEKNFFTFLAEIEQEHHDSLTTMLRFLKNA